MTKNRTFRIKKFLPAVLILTLSGSMFSATPDEIKISSVLQERMTASGESDIHAWIYFIDKGFANRLEIEVALENILSDMDERTRWRRGKTRGNSLVDERDIPVNSGYVLSVTRTGAQIRVSSRWLNAVSVSATPGMIRQIAEFPFVKRIDPVFGGKRMDPPEESPQYHDPGANRTEYGNSFDQLQQIGVIDAHATGYTGEGIRVLMLDTGFYKDHESIHTDQIIAEWDFINNDGNTQNEPGDPENAHNHGTYTLSTLGGSFDGQLYGPAYNAEFLLAKTEDVSQEVPIEEDWYVAGLEWGESLGADVASSSLGYIDWYTPEDLDGLTAVTTIAVNIAIENGMVITTAAGNSGEDGIIAPADAFDVITCGAVDWEGVLAWFSSVGPTADGRTKPEVCARGVSTWCADITSPSAYREASGTSLSTPLVGGAAAIILSAHPDWTPQMVREALMMTASNAETPDNQYGWGIINVMAALTYFDNMGDVTGDGELNVSDIVLTVNFILGVIQPTPQQSHKADMNHDGTVDVQDIIEMVNMIVNP